MESDATLPTVHNESVFITAAIDTHEDRDVVILDIPGELLHALTKDEVGMLLRGPLAETMVLIDPERYRPYVTHDKRRGADIICENEQGAIWAIEVGAGLLSKT